MAHRLPIKVRFYELDPYNHVNHSVYIQYFEMARIDLLESIGFGLLRLEDLGFRFVVTGITTRFLHSAGLGEELAVETEVKSVRRATSVWQQRLTRADELLATEIVDAALTDLAGRPTRLPAALTDALQPYLVPAPPP